MSNMKKIVATLVVGLLVGFALMGIRYESKVHAATDSWSAHNEVNIPFSFSITAGTSAPIFTGVSGVAANVRAIVVTNTASGGVHLYSDSTVTGSALIGSYGVLANTPLVITEDNMGQGLKTVLGKGLYIEGTTGTISGTVRIRKDPN